jgi:hypothetical protein
MFQVFSGVSYVCLQLFYWMLNMFTMIFKCFSGVFTSVSYAYFKCFICIYLLFMLQLLHLNVSKVDQVLQMECTWEAVGGADDVQGRVGDVQGGGGPLPVRSLASPTC